MILRFHLLILIIIIVAVEKTATMPVRGSRSAIEHSERRLESLTRREATRHLRSSMQISEQDGDSLADDNVRNIRAPVKSSFQDFESLDGEKVPDIKVSKQEAYSENVAKKRNTLLKRENLLQDLNNFKVEKVRNIRLVKNPLQDFEILKDDKVKKALSPNQEQNSEKVAKKRNVRPSMQDFDSLVDADVDNNSASKEESKPESKKRYVRSPLTQAERELDKLADAQGPPLMRTQRPIFDILQDIIRTFQGGVKKMLGRARARASSSEVDAYEKYKNCRLEPLKLI